MNLRYLLTVTKKKLNLILSYNKIHKHNKKMYIYYLFVFYCRIILNSVFLVTFTVNKYHKFEQIIKCFFYEILLLFNVIKYKESE